MNANELADYVDAREINNPHLREAATMLRQQQAEIETLRADGRVLMQHIADMNEEKNKLRHQKSYLIELEQALESSINLNKAQAERHRKA